MNHVQMCLWKREERHGPRWHARLVVMPAVVAFCFLATSSASAAEVAASQLPTRDFPVAHIFTFLFLMLGPFKIIGPFATLTNGMDARSTRQVALWATLFSSLALALAGIAGERSITTYGIPVPVLGLAAGILLFLVALIAILQQFATHEPRDAATVAPALRSPMKVALSQLAFPTIVTPYGVATLVVFLALSPDLQGRLLIGGILLVIMLLNLGVMLVVRRIMPILAIGLPIAAAVLGIVQVALGLQIIINSLKALAGM